MSTIVTKEYQGGALQDALFSNITSSSPAIVGTDASTYPTGSSYPYVIELDRGTDNAEKILCSSRSGNTHTVQTRGYDGTSAVSHDAPATIHHVLDALSLTHLWLHVTDVTRDDHTQYIHAVNDLGTVSDITATGTSKLAGTTGRYADAGHRHTIGVASISSDTMFAAAVVNNPAIANDAITTDKIAAGQVTTVNIADASVTPAKLGAQSSARAYDSVGYNINNTTTTVLPTFNSERWDTGSIHSTVTNTGRLTPPLDGLYLLTAHVSWAANATGFRQVGFLVNGSATVGNTRTMAVTTASEPTVQSVATLYRLSASDYAEVVVYQNSGGSLGITVASNYSPEFSMVRIGA